MARSVVFLYSVVITFLELTINANLSTQDQSHDVLAETVIDGVTVNFHEYANGNGDLEYEEPLIPPGVLHLEPPQLRFEKGPLCLPRAASVFITNRSNSTVRLNAISANSPHFHSSFFEKKTLPPDGNTTFNVVFLGREKGILESTLFVHTSRGTFKYPVSGVGVESEYRLEHLVGIRIPSNASFEPIIHLHNPRDTYIQMTEASTSDERLSLRLPGGEAEAGEGSSAAVWRLPPHTTRPVLKLHALPNTPHNTYYLRIRVEGKLLVVVVELTAEPAGRAFAEPAIVSAGRGGTLDAPTTIGLYASNSGPTRWRVRGGGVRSRSACARPLVPPSSRDLDPPASAHLRVLDSVLPPFSSMVRVAELTVDWARVYTSGECTGSIRVLTEGDSALVYTYHAHAMPGTLRMDHSALTFVLSDPDGVSERNLSVTNMFMRDIHITDILLGDHIDKYFYVTASTPLRLQSTEGGVVVSLRPRSPSLSQSLDSHVTLVSDLGEYTQPVLLYSETSEIIVTYLDQLSLMRPRYGLDALELGFVPADKVHVRFSLMPRAPLLACLPLGASHSQLRPRNLRCLPSGEPCSCIDNQAEFDLVIEESINGWLQIGSQRMNVHVTLVEGRFTAAPVTIDKCPLGALCKAPLVVDNTLDTSLIIKEIVIDGDEKNLYYRSEWKGAIPAHWSGSIGTLYYAQVMEPEDVEMGSDPAARDHIERDLVRANQRYEMFRRQPPTHRLSIQILTDMTVVGARCDVQVELTWPSFLANESDRSASIASDSARTTVTLYNPTRRMLAVSLVRCDSCADKLHPELRSGPQPAPPSPPSALSLPAPRWFLLPPRANHHITLGVHSKGVVTQLFYIRNNFTMMEEIRVSGVGSEPNVRLGGQKAGSLAPLTLQVLAEQIADCAHSQVVARRAFNIRNHGHSPIKISGAAVNGLPCAGYGFQIFDCEQFVLEPNATKKIDILFVPDFTLSRIRRQLTFTTDRGYRLDFLLEATLPALSCAKCLVAQPRPKWEGSFHSLVTAVALASAAFVLAFAFLESDRILKAAAAITRDRSEAQPLDLRNISNKWEWPSEEENKTEKESPKVKKRVCSERAESTREMIMEFEREMCQEGLLTQLLKSSHSVTIIHPPVQKDDITLAHKTQAKETATKACETERDTGAGGTTSPTLTANEAAPSKAEASENANSKPVKRTKPKHKSEETPSKVESIAEPAKVEKPVTRKSLTSETPVEVETKAKPARITKKERIAMKHKKLIAKQQDCAVQTPIEKPVKTTVIPATKIIPNITYANTAKKPLKKELSDPIPKRNNAQIEMKNIGYQRQSPIGSNLLLKPKSTSPNKHYYEKNTFTKPMTPISQLISQNSLFSNNEIPMPRSSIFTRTNDYGLNSNDCKSEMIANEYRPDVSSKDYLTGLAPTPTEYKLSYTPARSAWDDSPADPLLNDNRSFAARVNSDRARPELTPVGQRSHFNDFTTSSAFSDPTESGYAKPSWGWGESKPTTKSTWGAPKGGLTWGDRNVGSSSAGGSSVGCSSVGCCSAVGCSSVGCSSARANSIAASSTAGRLPRPPGFSEPETRTYDPFQTVSLWFPDSVVGSKNIWAAKPNDDDIN